MTEILNAELIDIFEGHVAGRPSPAVFCCQSWKMAIVCCCSAFYVGIREQSVMTGPIAGEEEEHHGV